MNKKLLKTITLMLVWALAAMECVWAGGSGFSCGQKTVTNLSPKVGIEAAWLKGKFYELCDEIKTDPATSLLTQSLISNARESLIVMRDDCQSPRLNFNLLESMVRQTCNAIIAGSLLYLADESGFIRIDYLSDIDIIPLENITGIKCNIFIDKLVKNLGACGLKEVNRKIPFIEMRFDRLTGGSLQLHLITLPGGNTKNSIIVHAKISQDYNSTHITKPDVDGSIIFDVKWIKRYLSVEYFYGDMARHKRNLDAFLSCRNNEEISKLRKRIVNLGDLQSLINDINMLSDEEKYSRVEEKLLLDKNPIAEGTQHSVSLRTPDGSPRPQQMATIDDGVVVIEQAI